MTEHSEDSEQYARSVIWENLFVKDNSASEKILWMGSCRYFSEDEAALIMNSGLFEQQILNVFSQPKPYLHSQALCLLAVLCRQEGAQNILSRKAHWHEPIANAFTSLARVETTSSMRTNPSIPFPRVAIAKNILSNVIPSLNQIPAQQVATAEAPPATPRTTDIVDFASARRHSPHRPWRVRAAQENPGGVVTDLFDDRSPC